MGDSAGVTRPSPLWSTEEPPKFAYQNSASVPTWPREDFLAAMEAKIEELKTNSAMGKSDAQSSCRSATKCRRKVLIVWFAHSVCLLVRGCQAVDGAGRIQRSRWTLVQNWETKTEPQSVTILSGRPCKRMKRSRKTDANLSAVHLSLAGIRWAPLVRWSMITRIES